MHHTCLDRMRAVSTGTIGMPYISQVLSMFATKKPLLTCCIFRTLD